MAKVLVNESSLSGIANAIRGKNGSTNTYKPNEMAAAITAIEIGSGFWNWDEEMVKNFIQRKDAITEIQLPDGITKIGNGVFSNLKNLNFALLPNTITVIDENAFNGCQSLSLTTLPDSVEYINMFAFQNCTNLALTSLPNSLKQIDDYSFSLCSNLAITEIPANVENVLSYAFDSCTGLTNLTFRGTPTYISENVFYGCTNLTTINVPWAEGAVADAPWGATNATINYNYTE